MPPTLAKYLADDPSLPGRMSLTILVPVSVPLLLHSSRPPASPKALK